MKANEITFNLRIDWNLLHQQKAWLLARNGPNGLIELLDEIQDQGVRAGVLEEVVFPDDGVEKQTHSSKGRRR